MPEVLKKALWRLLVKLYHDFELALEKEVAVMVLALAVLANNCVQKESCGVGDFICKRSCESKRWSPKSRDE